MRRDPLHGSRAESSGHAEVECAGFPGWREESGSAPAGVGQAVARPNVDAGAIVVTGPVVQGESVVAQGYELVSSTNAPPYGKTAIEGSSMEVGGDRREPAPSLEVASGVPVGTRGASRPTLMTAVVAAAPVTPASSAGRQDASGAQKRVSDSGASADASKRHWMGPRSYQRTMPRKALSADALRATVYGPYGVDGASSDSSNVGSVVAAMTQSVPGGVVMAVPVAGDVAVA